MPGKISGEVLSKSFAEQTGAKLNVTIVPYDVIEAQATLDVQSGANQFDVVEYWYASIGSLVENNVLQDVTDLITKDEATIRTSDYIRSIYDPYTLYKGKRWGLPYDGDTHVLFYNTTLLDKHKVNAPTTWDEYLIAAKTITEAEKQNGVYGAIVMGAAIPVIIGSTFANRLAGFGGEFLKPDGTPNLESDAAFKAAKALLDVAPYALPTPVETAFEQAVPSFLDGKGAFVECWTDLGIYAQDAQKSKIIDQWDVVQLPVEKKGDQPRACRRVGVSACRPEGPRELSPGFSLGWLCFWHVRSEGPRESYHVGLSKSPITHPNRFFEFALQTVLQTGRLIKHANPG
jgi:multiple sugar transport system substrate-binding protein